MINNIRIGNGLDIHKISKQKTKQKLGGVEFDLDYKVIAFSDGDIVLHSISSAILGALSLRDLGSYYSDNDQKNKGIDSQIILSNVLKFMEEKLYEISNIDITIVCEYIYFANIKDKILENLVNLLKTNNISIKATRYEEEKNMIEAHTTLLLIKK